ncbi:pirin family protein [Pyruvatibacter mobilis]|uniref:pirin family protein n=1 Tax=Pyruvatibacter mobilis TaxID=1712261 RepID=UPI003BB11216
MSWQPSQEADCTIESGCAPVSAVIVPKAKDLGGFEVRRVLPAIEARSVGPFIFFDHMGPATFPAGDGIDVRPHPHIGLSTLTWLFDGALMHRDSLGSVQEIRPGEVNWMTAGSGIVHSERSPDWFREGEARIEGIQTWHALPTEMEEIDPDFQHYSADDIPVVEHESADGGQVRVALIAGGAFGMVSPVKVHSDTLYADVRLSAGAQFGVPTGPQERALYVVSGTIEIAGQTFGARQMLLIDEGATPSVTSAEGAHLMLIGGAPIGPRKLWWNLVSTRPERIEQAKDDWREGRFARVPGDEDEFIPLPED